MATSSEHAVQSVLAALTRRNASAAAAPLAITGPKVEEPKEDDVKSNHLVVYSARGRKLNFDPEELQKPPESFADDAKALKEWNKLLPVYTRKALTQTHFQNMSLEEIRGTMERAVAHALLREREDRKKKRQKQNEKKLRDRATPCVLLRNLAPPGGLVDSLYDDVVGECGRFGSIQNVSAYEVSREEGMAKGLEPEEAVRIFVHYADKESAIRAHDALHMKFFDERRIAVAYYPVDRFEKRDLAPDLSTESKLPPQCRMDYVEPEAAPEADAAVAAAGAKPVRKVPAKVLPKYHQALIDVIKAAANGEEVSTEMIHAADPVAKQRDEAAEAARVAAAEAEERLKAALAMAAVMAAQINDEHEATRKRKLEAITAAPLVTDDVGDID